LPDPSALRRTTKDQASVADSGRTSPADVPMWGGTGAAPTTDETQRTMTQLLVQIAPLVSPAPCALCSGECRAGGPRLVSEDLRPVCDRCGKAKAPALMALVQLADEAARVAKIGRNTVFPPYGALLDLARAADTYVTAPR
jgi:hypothetical protein